MRATRPASDHPIRLGLGANAAQFALLVGVNGLVGALAGQERTLVPLLGERVFGLTSATAATAFLVTFGLAKAASNLAAGVLADRIGRKRVLVAGWLVGIPVPLLLMWAPSWGWIVGANALLGINQGLTWSTTVVMKIDLAGPRRRGLAMGLNEFAGYLGVAVSAAASGFLASRYGLRPEPLFLGIAVIGLGLGISLLAVRETAFHARFESGAGDPKGLVEVLALVSGRDRALAAVSRTGMVNNANDAFAWGLLPLLMAREGLDAVAIGAVAAVYPAVWSLGQLVTGSLSDRIGRRLPIALGMFVQSGALVAMLGADSVTSWVAAASVLGLGTALVYPSLLAAVGDLSHPTWRAAAVGAYRSWRDLGYVVGALVAGAAADLFGLRAALVVVAALTALSGLDAWRGVPSFSIDNLNRLR
ncbi:MAG: MFS transporter [Actinomycetota bacterium]